MTLGARCWLETTAAEWPLTLKRCLFCFVFVLLWSVVFFLLFFLLFVLSCASLSCCCISVWNDWETISRWQALQRWKCSQAATDWVHLKGISARKKQREGWRPSEGGKNVEREKIIDHNHFPTCNLFFVFWNPDVWETFRFNLKCIWRSSDIEDFSFFSPLDCSCSSQKALQKSEDRLQWPSSEPRSVGKRKSGVWSGPRLSYVQGFVQAPFTFLVSPQPCKKNKKTDPQTKNKTNKKKNNCMLIRCIRCLEMKSDTHPESGRDRKS